MVQFTITGPVENFATVDPPRVVLRGRVGEDLRASVKIIPEKEFPFSILRTKTKYGRYISLSLEPVKEGGGYLLTVENRRGEPGRYFDIVSLITDSAIRPELQVSVTGFIRPAVGKTGASN